MVSYSQLKINLRKQILVLLKEKDGINLSKNVSRICLDTGLKDITVLKILEMMENMEEIVIKNGEIFLEKGKNSGK